MDKGFKMTGNEMLKKLEGIFRDIFDEEDLKISNETTAEDIEDWDSLAHINLVVAIEKEFNVKFALGELQLLQNVGDMVELILKKFSKD
jgi:acyl carrier protein